MNMRTGINKRLSVHHIGGRYGSRAFPFLDKFEKDIINVLYDADPDCIAQIRKKNQLLESELHVLPYCLGNACKSTYFNINYDPYASSLFTLNPDYGSYYFFNADHDCILSEAYRTMEKRKTALVTLDHIFSLKSISIPPPDFLSIDTQGSEYEILQGTKETLKSSVVALVVEVWFHPTYKDQKLFGDISRLLSDQGFDFVKFLGIHELSPFRASVGLRGKGFHMYTDALFFRRVDNVVNDGLDYYVMLQKLAFIAIIFNQFEYGLQCLHRSRGLVSPNSAVKELEGHTYYQFLRELEEQIERMPEIFPKNTFASKYTFEASRARFESPPNLSKTVQAHGIKEILRKTPFVLTLYFLLMRMKRFRNKLISQVGVSLKFRFTGYTGVESVLVKYGLKVQANVLKENRIVQSRF